MSSNTAERPLGRPLLRPGITLHDRGKLAWFTERMKLTGVNFARTLSTFDDIVVYTSTSENHRQLAKNLAKAKASEKIGYHVKHLA